MYKLTETGRHKAELYIQGLQEKRKEILDSGKDTADDVILPTVEDLEDDLEWFEDDDGTSWNVWPVTDHYDADYPVCFEKGTDYVDTSFNPTEGIL